MPNLISEAEVENHILELLKSLGYKIKSGPELYPDGIFNERNNYSQVLLKKDFLIL